MQWESYRIDSANRSCYQKESIHTVLTTTTLARDKPGRSGDGGPPTPLTLRGNEIYQRSVAIILQSILARYDWMNPTRALGSLRAAG